MWCDVEAQPGARAMMRSAAEHVSMGELHGEATLEALQDLQAEAMADDLPIDLERMRLWSKEEAAEYFESGGQVDPGMPSDDALRGGAYERDWAHWMSPLEPLGRGGPLLCGEALDQRKRCYAPKPAARMRLFVLYGVADVCMTSQPWMLKAPDWLEVRLLELPGHGFRQDEPLPACSAAGPLDEAALIEQRAALASQLADEVTRAAGDAPFALYGFSYGALLMYETARILAARASPLPACLCVAGRGAPHCFALSRASCEMYATSEPDGVLEAQGGLMSTGNIPAHMRPRAAALFRCGMLLGALPPEASTLLDGVDFHNAKFAERVPPVPAGCPVLAVTSDADTVWPAKLSARWVDVAASGAFRGKTLGGVPHEKLMNHAETMTAVFGEVAAAAKRLASSRR